MRKISILALIMVAVFLLIPLAAIGSAAEYSAIEFTDVTCVRQGGTYPRMTALENGALEYYFESGYKYSLDSGLTFNTASDKAGTSTTTNAAATQTVGADSHTLSRANQHALELSDGTMMLAYRSHSKENVNGKFYTSIRVMTKSNYTGTYANEQIIVESVYTSTSGERRGYWEPFLIQLDDTTVAMYYADDLSPADNGKNQYIMVVLYDIETGTWGTPSIVVNKEKTMGREGMPMVARLTDGSYVMAVESHCLQDEYYIFAVRLWFSRDGLTWDNGVAVAAPAIRYDWGLNKNERNNYWCAAPCVTVLPDGRIAVSYQDNYENSDDRDFINDERSYNATPCLIVSKDRVTYDNASRLSATERGISSSFTSVSLNLTEHESIKGTDHENDIYGLWNSTFYANGYLYYCSSVGYNTSPTTRKSLGTYVCRALVEDSAVPDAAAVAADYGTLHVSNPEQLLQIMNDSTMWKRNIVLDNDIDLSKTVYAASRGIGQTPIGYAKEYPFTGTFDGNGYTVTGLNISNTESGKKTALFGYCDGAVIKNCTLYGSVVSNGEYCGAFAGYSQNSRFAGLTSYAKVSGTNCVGGIAGRVLGGSKGSEVVNCVNYGDVSGTANSVGGIVGLLDTNTGAGVNTTVAGCVNYGAVSGNSYVGGILGQINHLTTKGAYVYLKNSVNYGSVTASAATSCAAGVVGQIQTSASSANSYNGNVEISRCENNGEIKGKSLIGGILGNANLHSNGSTVKLKVSECKNHAAIGGAESESYVGGIAGRTLGTSASRTEISLCYNGGAVSCKATGKDIGGIIAVAKYTDVSDCESRGSLNTNSFSATDVGGIVGRTDTSASVTRCYFAGEIAGAPIVGNPVACSGSNNYYCSDSSVDSYGTLVQQNKGEASYCGLDFDNVWYATVLGPKLRYGKTFLKGDINDNGRVDVLDAVILKRYLAGWNGYEEYIVFDSADLTNFGTINVVDAVYLVRSIAGWRGYELGEN